MSAKLDAEKIEADAKPQFEQGKSKKGATNSGVSSAEPRVITGDEDATFATHPEKNRKPPQDRQP